MPPRFAFAGDRDISVWVLDYLLERDCVPSALLVSASGRASHAAELESRLPRLSDSTIFRGTDFRTPAALEALGALELDYIIAVHFPYIFPPAALRLPRVGVLNLHPAYLPYNRGWHTATWAILEDTPIGATLHFMDEGVDTGDIVHQLRLTVSPGDTANSLYQKIKRLELEAFRQAWPAIEAGSILRTPQSAREGSSHTKEDLSRREVQRIDCDAQVRAGDLLRQLRGLTTDRLSEAAYFEVDGRRFRVQVAVYPE